MQRFAVVVDDPAHGPFFLPHADTGMPQLFISWEEADATAQMLAEVRACPTAVSYQVIRLEDG